MDGHVSSEETPVAVPAPTHTNIADDLQQMLEARRLRLLERPLIASILPAVSTTASRPEKEGEGRGNADHTTAELLALAGDCETTPALPQGEDSSQSGSYAEESVAWRVRVAIDYEDRWYEREKEVRDAVAGALDMQVVCLTDAEMRLLLDSPTEYLRLLPRPAEVTLVDFALDPTNRRPHVVELTLASAPPNAAHVRHIGVLPNLIPLERQLEALAHLQSTSDTGSLAPLRTLLGLNDGCALPAEPRVVPASSSSAHLDEHQLRCVEKALATPHFAVIEGPPGSGKTSVIAEIIRRSLALSERVLVVSPTHAAVDNVVERLVRSSNREEDSLAPHTLPVRYAARQKKLSPVAATYWVGPNHQRRGATIAKRLESCLTKALPLAAEMFKRVDEDATGIAPLSSAVASVDSVLCGTPVGLLSHEGVRQGGFAAFDLLVVDEVSKLTLAEFLAIAARAKRWVLVGDPAQLAAYNDVEDNACSLNGVVSPEIELACSVSAQFSGGRGRDRSPGRLLVVATRPEHIVRLIGEQARSSAPERAPSFTATRFNPLGTPAVRVVVCTANEAEAAWRESQEIAAARGVLPSTERPRVLVERGLEARCFGADVLVSPRERALPRFFEGAFQRFHAEPWAKRSRVRLSCLGDARGLERLLPSRETVRAAHEGEAVESDTAHEEIVKKIVLHYALSCVSVFDWLVGVPQGLTSAPLPQLTPLPSRSLQTAVGPYRGRLANQYRMHPSLSRVPRELFYFGEALRDGRTDGGGGERAMLRQVSSSGEGGEHNQSEVNEIVTMLANLARNRRVDSPGKSVMVITPYREQERVLHETLESAGLLGDRSPLEVEVCTLDRCQGREADVVLISLVRSRASKFFEAPNRWNVAVTRAREGMFLIGDIDAYLREAREARASARRGAVPAMSTLARVIEAYAAQTNSIQRGVSR